MTEKKCPFNNDFCSKECALYIDAEDLNESVSAKLSSLGVIDKENSCCSLKTLAMSSARFIFENSTTTRR